MKRRAQGAPRGVALLVWVALGGAVAGAIAQEPPSPPKQGTTSKYPIDLATVLRLAGAQNLDVALARSAVQEAHANYASAIEANPRYAPFYNDLSRLLATCPDATRRDPQRAVGLAKQAVRLDPERSSYWSTLGTAHYRAGDWKAAVAALHTSLEKSNGGTAGDWVFLAMSHWKLGDRAEARKRHHQAVQWMEQNQANMSRNSLQAEALRRCRSEADEVLGLKQQ